MIAKSITKILRGSATPAQLMLACVLGAALGFMPGFAQSPGLIIALAMLLLVLNANLALVVMIAGVAKLASLLLLPVSFALGRLLLDGPTEPLFKAMINAPVLALFGFEYYTATGGLLLGVGLGACAGAVLIKLIKRIRTTMAGLEEGSELYRQWVGKWWVRLLLRMFVGGGAKESYTTLLEKKGRVIRPVGIVVCVLAIIFLVAAQSFLSGPLFTSAIQRGLTQANGATVDLESAVIDLAQGRMTITGLAMADPNALDVDLFRAATIEADVSATSLLRKRIKLDRVVISDASHGEKRATPGRIVGNKPVPTKSVEPNEGEKTLQDYLRDPGQWQQRLVQIRRWVEQLSGPLQRRESGEEAAASESLRERLEREARELGYARVAANHLIEGAPSFSVAELLAEKVRTDALQGETINLRATNLSTHPHLVDETPTVALESSAKTLRLALVLGAAAFAGGESSIDFEYRGLSVDSISGSLSSSGAKPVSGGTMDLAMKGTVRTSGGTYIDLPLQITLHDTTIAVAGKSAPVKELTIPLGLRGPIDSPRIRLDDSKLADALVAAGAAVLASEVRSRADDLIKGAVSDIDLKGGVPQVDLKQGLPKIDLKGMLPGAGGKPKADASAKKAPKKKDELRDKAKSLTEGLFGKKKKKKD